MRKIWIVSLLAILLLGTAVWSQAQTTGEIEKAVMALEDQWVQAQNINNPDLLAPLLADKFVNTSLDGKVTGKAEALADVRSYVKDSGANSQVKVIVYGDTAIAIGIWKGQMKDPSGKIIDFNVQWTDTWAKMPTGKWQCVASHQSPTKM
jgi:ketosteroid isomerase-like protein